MCVCVCVALLVMDETLIVILFIIMCMYMEMKYKGRKSQIKQRIFLSVCCNSAVCVLVYKSVRSIFFLYRTKVVYFCCELCSYITKMHYSAYETIPS